MSKARVGQDSLEVNDEVADVDEKAASANVGIDVAKGEGDTSKGDGDSQLKENRPRRRRNIIIGIIIIIIILIAIAVGAALGTKKNGNASSTKQSDLTTIDVEGLALEIKGVSGPLSADAAAVFGTEYCNHFKDYYNNVGPTRDEMPSLQRNIDVVDCSIEVDRRRLLRRHLAVTGPTATMPDETLILSFSQSTTIEASNELFIPIPHILTAPLESEESKEIFSDNVSDALLEAGIDDFGDIEIGELLLPESLAPPLPASTGQVDNPICPLCPEGWAMDPAIAGNMPLQGYAADITAALDPYVQYEYILAVLTFEQSNCKEIESVLRSKKLNSLLSGKEWAEKTCDKLQSHMLGRCCTSVGMLSPVDPLPEPLPDSDIDPPLESTPQGEYEPPLESTPGEEYEPPLESTPGEEYEPPLESTPGEEYEPPLESTPRDPPFPKCLDDERLCPDGTCILSIECCEGEQLCPTTGDCMDAQAIRWKCPPCFKNEKKCSDGSCIKIEECCKNEEICPSTGECVHSFYINNSKYCPCMEGGKYVCCEGEVVCEKTGKCVEATKVDQDSYCPKCDEGEKYCDGGSTSRCVPNSECCGKRCLDGQCSEQMYKARLSKCCVEDACPGTVITHNGKVSQWTCPTDACGCEKRCFGWPLYGCCCFPPEEDKYGRMFGPDCGGDLAKITGGFRVCSRGGGRQCS